MRDNNWLEEKLYEIWENNFNDIPRHNLVVIRFSKKSYRQLGCIKWAKNLNKKILDIINNNSEIYPDKRVSEILITSYFKDLFVPDVVVEGTIAHELCHYAHGFNSPLQQIYNHPHKGGIIKKEMSLRGMIDTYKQANQWLKSNWSNYIKSQKKL
jgi:hypothetical protein